MKLMLEIAGGIILAMIAWPLILSVPIFMVRAWNSNKGHIQAVSGTFTKALGSVLRVVGLIGIVGFLLLMGGLFLYQSAGR
jgi:hypothetical protein